MLAQYLLEMGKDEVIERFEKNRATFLEHSKSCDAFSERLSIKYGLILTAVELANEALNFNLTYDLILDMLVQNELETADSRDLAQIAYEYVIGQVNIFKAHFSTVATSLKIWDAQKDVWGLRESHSEPKEINGKKCNETVYIERTQLKKILSNGNFKDIDVIVKKWKERDLLNHEAGRNTRYRKMTNEGDKVHLYGLRIFDTPK